jgi:sugar lactone lactonase YvrE
VSAAALLPAAALAGGGPAAAVARAGGAGAPRASTVAGVISTVAGGVGGPARAIRVHLFLPCGASFGAGHLYIADATTVRAVNPGTDRLTTPAGTGAGAPLGDGGPATRASVDTCGVAVDHSGNLVIADTSNFIPNTSHHRIRVVAARTGTFYGRVMTGGHIYTVAGTGHHGHSGDGGPATSAKLKFPQDVAVDAAGNLLIADTGNNRIRVVAESTGTFYGQPMTAGDIYTVAGGGTNGLGDGGPATKAELGDPGSVAVDAAGNLLIADTDHSRVRVVAARTGIFYGQPMTAGDIYTIAGTTTDGFSGDGGPATAAELLFPGSVTVDGAGNLLIADTENRRVRVVAARTGTFYGQPMTAGDIYTIAGNGTINIFSGDRGPATSAQFDGLNAVAVDAAGNLVIADEANQRIRVVAHSTGTFYRQPMTAGDIYTVAGGGTNGLGDGGPATKAELNNPSGVAVDAAGNLLIADLGNFRVRVVAARTGTFYGQPMTAGDIYTVAGDGAIGFSGDGGPATSAELGGQGSVAVDAAGNLLIADTENDRIRVVAARTGTFYGQPMTAQDIYTIAGGGGGGDGGPATKAALNFPRGVATDAARNLLIADTEDNRIRVVAARTGTFYGQPMTAGDIYTVAGTGTQGFSGDGGPATSAELNFPQGVAVDAAGNLVVADTGNNRVRVVAARTGTFYAQAMTAGNIYTIAGNGRHGFSGDGGPATKAELGPSGVAVDAAGNLLIADTGNQRIRMETG